MAPFIILSGGTILLWRARERRERLRAALIPSSTAVILLAILAGLASLASASGAYIYLSRPSHQAVQPTHFVQSDLSGNFDLAEMGGANRHWYFRASKQQEFGFNESTIVWAQLRLATGGEPSESWASIDSPQLANASACVTLAAPGFDQEQTLEETCRRQLPTTTTPAEWTWVISPRDGTMGVRSLAWSLSILPQSSQGQQIEPGTADNGPHPVFSIWSKVNVDKPWWRRNPEFLATLLGVVTLFSTMGVGFVGEALRRFFIRVPGGDATGV